MRINQRPSSRDPSNKMRQMQTEKLPKQNLVDGNSIWVTKWVDYSTKYGLGYRLSDGSSGVFFNDSTKVIVEQNGQNFFYYERKAISSTEK